ncbi:MAG TPA: hypothetical protein VGH93_12850 [Solirubrobacteraceae bacterium]
MANRRGAVLELGLAAAIAVAAALGTAAAHPLTGPPARHLQPLRRSPTRPLPAADCQPFGASPCLLPFPDNRLTIADASTPTGVRVDLPAAAMPVNRLGERIEVGEYDRADGFSPGSSIVVHVPGLDNGAALRASGVAGLGAVSRSLQADHPIALIDEQTGRRQAMFSELDPTAFTPQTSDLIIHPAADLLAGHTYVVALRNLRNARDRPIAAPAWFQLLLGGTRLSPRAAPERARYARIFLALRRAGIVKRGLYEAWDFTVASTRSLDARLVAIRDDAFAQLGDPLAADGQTRGRAPTFTVTSVEQLGPQLRRVQGTLEVPCYLTACGEGVPAGFNYASGAPDALPSQIPGAIATVPFDCIVPSSATAAQPARVALYGHGLLSSRAEVEAAWMQQMAIQHNLAFCASDWWGLASADLTTLVEALRNVNELPSVVDRIQQGILNMLYLGRLMISPQGLASSAALQSGGRPLIDTSNLYYDGNSIGGILGGVLTAVSPDVRRAVLGVTGSDFFTLLVPHGDVFAKFGEFVTRNYPDHSLHPLILDLLEQVWTRADPGGYAERMTSQPLPQTPAHTVLMQIAYGDFQVSMYPAAVEARSIGASAHEPALDTSRDGAGDRQLLFGIPPITHYPFAGSAIFVWDSGRGHTPQPPLEGPAGPRSASDSDPHEDPRYTPAAQEQSSLFMQPQGQVVDVCDGAPCHSYDYVP